MSRLGAASIAVGCGGIGAGLYLAVLLGSPGGLILVYLTQLPLFLSGLWLGAGAAAIAGGTACLVLLVVSDLMAMAVFTALNAVPVVVLVRQALLARPSGDGAVRWYPPGLLAAWLTAIALGGIAAAILILGGPETFHASLRTLIARTLDRLPLEGIPDRGSVSATLALVIPGIVAASWMVMTVINAALAQGVLVRFKANWRPSPNLALLDLPIWVSVAFALAAAAMMFGGTSRFLGANALIALVVPFSMAGLAIVHAALRNVSNRGTALVVFYAVAGIFGWPLVVAALLGLFEPWLGLRRRFASGKGKTDD